MTEGSPRGICVIYNLKVCFWSQWTSFPCTVHFFAQLGFFIAVLSNLGLMPWKSPNTCGPIESGSSGCEPMLLPAGAALNDAIMITRCLLTTLRHSDINIHPLLRPDTWEEDGRGENASPVTGWSRWTRWQRSWWIVVTKGPHAEGFRMKVFPFAVLLLDALPTVFYKNTLMLSFGGLEAESWCL